MWDHAKQFWASSRLLQFGLLGAGLLFLVALFATPSAPPRTPLPLPLPSVPGLPDPPQVPQVLVDKARDTTENLMDKTGKVAAGAVGVAADTVDVAKDAVKVGGRIVEGVGEVADWLLPRSSTPPVQPKPDNQKTP